MALFSKTAATLLSTPPERPRITRSEPIVCRNSATVVSTKLAGLQSCRPPQMSTTKLRSSCVPCTEWNTSGWNCTPHTRPLSAANAALRTWLVLAIGWKPSGSAVMVSPWLIHTWLSGSKP